MQCTSVTGVEFGKPNESFINSEAKWINKFIALTNTPILSNVLKNTIWIKVFASHKNAWYCKNTVACKAGALLMSERRAKRGQEGSLRGWRSCEKAENSMRRIRFLAPCWTNSKGGEKLEGRGWGRGRERPPACKLAFSSSPSTGGREILIGSLTVSVNQNLSAE